MTENKFLKEVNKLIENQLDEIKPTANLLHAAGSHLSLAENAKRIRASLTYLSGTYLGISSDLLLLIATSAELVHAASLMHDDVIDTSSKRRSQSTSNILYGNTISVLGGDLLYSLALELLNKLPRKVLEDAVHVVKEMTMAVSQEYLARGNVHLTSQEWMEIAKGKTALLFAWSIKSPAVCANDLSLYEQLSTTGLYLGYAFQIADDLKDFFSNSTLGKKRYTDIYNKNPNYILIIALQKDPSLASMLEEFWKNYDKEILKKIIERINQLNAPSLALKDFIQYFKKSLQNLEYVYIKKLSGILKKMFFSLKLNTEVTNVLKQDIEELKDLLK